MKKIKPLLLHENSLSAHLNLSLRVISFLMLNVFVQREQTFMEPSDEATAFPLMILYSLAILGDSIMFSIQVG